MSRFSAMLFFLILLAGLGCRAMTARPTATAWPSVTASPTLTSTARPAPSASPTFTPTVLPTLPGEATQTPEAAYTVRYHPDGQLYVGDLVSFEVIAPAGAALNGAQLAVQVDAPEGPRLGPAPFAPFGIAGRLQATLIWAWDTQGLSPGEHRLTFEVIPEGPVWEETVRLLPAEALPADEAGAAWASKRSACCTIYYITGSAAERDLAFLSSLADEQAQRAIERMGIGFSEPITITILPRLLGHGGFAAEEIHVSYLDRNYAANAWDMVVLHEMIHILDQRLGGDLRPAILVEGLAVYLAGGHYKPEPLLPRAAALLRLGWYLPLGPLADDFYASQHEIGYLEAGALVEYMVERWGWERFSAFYRDIHPDSSGKQSAALEAALQVHFGLSLGRLESDFLEALEGQAEADLWVEDVRLTVRYYDTLRRYQQALDSSAYFATAWLLDSRQMRERNLVADFLRRPSTAENLALETLLISAGEDLLAAPYERAEAILEAVNGVLEGIEGGATDPFAPYPLAADYLAIARRVQEAGYEVDWVEIEGDTAYVLADAPGLEQRELRLTRQGGGWALH